MDDNPNPNPNPNQLNQPTSAPVPQPTSEPQPDLASQPILDPESDLLPTPASTAPTSANPSASSTPVATTPAGSAPSPTPSLDTSSPIPQLSLSPDAASTAINNPKNAPKKRAKTAPWVIVAIVALLIFAFYCIGSIFGRHSQFQVGDLTADYPSGWLVQQSGALESNYDSDSILFVDSALAEAQFSYLDTDQYYYFTEQAASEIQSLFESSDYVYQSDDEETIDINGQTWQILHASHGDELVQQYVTADSYSIYFVHIHATADVFDRSLASLQDTIMSMRISSPDDELSQLNAKNALTGEWALTDDRRVTFGADDSFELYFNNDNIIRGTYVAYDKVPTAAAGYNYNGYNIIVTVTEVIADGEMHDNYNDTQLQFVLVHDEDGEYTFMNMMTYDTYPATKLN